jgi:SSS family solute:Na+ symporter/sodium/proline symporter
VVVILGIAAYFLSTQSQEFLSVALLAYTIYGAGITPVLIAAFFWKRATGPAAVSSIVSGTATAILWNQLRYGAVHAVLPAIVVSVVTLVVVSLLSERPPQEKVRPFLSGISH